MKPEFIAMNMLGPNGTLTKVLVNPERVCIILPINVPGMIDGPGGEKIAKAAAGLDFGSGAAIPVDYSVKEAQKRLEGNQHA